MKRFAAPAAVLWILGLLALGAWQSRALHQLAGWLLHTGPRLGAAALVCASGWGLGRWGRSRLLPDFAGGDPLARAVVDAALGLAVLQCVAVAAGSLGVFGAWTGRALTLPGLLLALRRPPKPLAPRVSAALLMAALLMAPALIAMGAPAIGPDEGQYHRRFIEHLLRTGAFPGDAQDPVSGLAMGLHALAGLAASWGGVGAARPFCLLLGVGGLIAGERVARSTFGAGVGWLYLLVVCGAAGWLRALPTINSDVPLSLFLGAAVLLGLDWLRAPEAAEARPWLIGVLGGAALSIKYTAPVFFAPLFVLLGLELLRQAPGRPRARLLGSLVGAALLPALFALPWLVRNALEIGHPLAPMAGYTVPAGLEAAFRFNFTENYGAGSGLAAWARTPWDLFVLGTEFDRRHFLGRLGIWPLVALPGLLLACRDRSARFLAGVAWLGLLLWAVPLRRVAYLLPLWPVLAAASAGGLLQLCAILPRGGAPALALLLAASAASEVTPAWRSQVLAVPVASGSLSEAEWLATESEEEPALAWLRAHTEADEAIGMLWAWKAWDLPNRLLWLGAEEHTPFRLLVHQAGTAEELERVVRAEGVRWLLHRRMGWTRGSYAALSDAEYEQAFLRPLALVDELLATAAVRRWERGAFTIYELPAAAGE